MIRPATRVVIVDLDNTLYDWVEFYVSAFEAMIAELAGTLHADEGELIDQFRDVYRQHGSVEYAFATQKIAACVALGPNERRAVVDTARQAFGRARNENLHCYSGVAETLQEICNREIMMFAATNAPLFQAQRRLRHLGILDHFDGIAARSSFDVPTSEPEIEDVRQRAARGDYEREIEAMWTFETGDLKPSSKMYERVISATSSDPRHVLVAGDSLRNDIEPAMHVGSRCAWARYGATPRPELMQTLLRVTPWTASAIDRDRDAVAQSELPTLSQFGELLAYL